MNFVIMYHQTCIPSEDLNQLAHPCSLIGLHCSPEKNLNPWLSTELPEKTQSNQSSRGTFLIAKDQLFLRWTAKTLIRLY